MADVDRSGAAVGRMPPIATLPVFFKLGGARVVVAGGTTPAVWKAELLSAAGAHVEVLDAQPCPAMVELAAAPPAGSITLVRRAWQLADLSHAAIALGAIEDEAEAARFREAARSAGVPVNVIDKPAFCDFQFGTIVSRSPLMIGISTDGAAPVFGQAIRTRLEAFLPQGLTAWARAARDWRPSVQSRHLDFHSRRRFWEVFATRALETPDDPPTGADFKACLAGVADAGADTGRVTVVGAGSGAADAVTLEAVRALQDADIVVYGPSVSPVVVGYARREAEKIRVDTAASLDDTIRPMMHAVACGRRVVWLDAGSPLTCLVRTARAERLARSGAQVRHVEGLGFCDDCPPHCPARTSGHAPARVAMRLP